MVLTLLILSLTLWGASAQWPHSWKTGGDALWADFGSPLLLASDKLSFIASTYNIVSLEKCLGHSVPMATEDAYIITAGALKALNPTLKTMFYFHASVDISGPSFTPCYAAGQYWLAHPELWLYGDDGVTPVVNGPFLFHNLTLAETQRYMVDVPMGVLKRAPNLFDGVFADGSLAGPYANVSAARTAEFNTALYNLGLTQSLALNAARPDAPGGVQVIGNGLAQYWYPNNPSFSKDDGMGMVPFYDGVCVEHFAAFEMTASNCSLVPDLMREMLENIAAVAALNKTVLIKGWPGPISTPITDLGPSWPAACGKVAGATHEERAQDMLDWFQPSYALFLLAVEPTVYWSYSWWYGFDDGYWAPANATQVNQTSAPLGWFPDLARPLGEPTGPAARVPGGSGWLYTRTFQHAAVTVDLADYRTTAKIVWS